MRRHKLKQSHHQRRMSCSLGEVLLGALSIYGAVLWSVWSRTRPWGRVKSLTTVPLSRSAPTTIPEPHICGAAACQSLRFMFGAQRDTSKTGRLALSLLFLLCCTIYCWEASLEGEDGFELEVFMQLLLKHNNQDTFHRFYVKNFNLSVFHLVGIFCF